MKTINNSKITGFLIFNLKLIVLSSLLFSQLSLSEIFLYENDPGSSALNVAKADSGDTWYNTSYLYRKEITVNSTKVPNTDQTNFPVLISLTDSALRTVANGGKVTNASGYDIIFANQAGNAKLDHEIESYDAATGTIVMWVKIPTLSHINNTVVYMYYGNASISTTQENKTGVWDSNFKMVQHMNQDPSGAGAQMKDSTANGNNGTTAGTMTSEDSVNGKIGKAIDLDAVDDYVDMGTNANLRPTGDMTVEGIIRVNDIHASDGIVSAHWARNDFTVPYLLSHGSSFAFKLGAGASEIVASGGTVVINTWFHVVGTISGDTVKLYVNGAEIGSAVFSGTRQTGERVTIGEVGSADGYHQGIIDEVRFSSVARSADWITTEYNNQSAPTPGAGNFILPLGTEEAYATAYTLTATSVSGLVGVPSQNFTIAPVGIYTGTITITPSGGGLSDIITKTFTNSSVPQTFTITPTVPGTVTLTPTNNGNLSNPSAVTYGSISISAGPASVIQGTTGNIITLDGISTSWTSGTPGSPTFTLSGGNGAAITSQIITDTTHATLTINAGSNTGNLTLTDPSTGATVTITVTPSTFVGIKTSTKPIVQLQNNHIDISNLPKGITQIAISRTPDFKNISWEAFDPEKFQTINQTKEVLYIKFRTDQGAVSDVLTIPVQSVSINISDGDIVKTVNNPDVYIIKIKNNKQYKRLVLSPNVFKSYGHLKWSNLKIISQEELNQYATSDLVKETLDSTIYSLFPNGDTGERRMIGAGNVYDTDSVYEINKIDRDSYKLVK